MESIFLNLENYGYIALFLYSLGGGFFGLIVAVILATLGKMNLFIVFIVVILANFIGDMILFHMARNSKKSLKDIIKKHRRKVALSYLLIKKYGDIVIFIQKFIYGVKTLIPLIYGISKYSMVKFAILNFLASIVFVLIVGGASYIASDLMLNFAKYLKENIYILPIFILTILGAVYLYFTKISKKA